MRAIVVGLGAMGSAVAHHLSRRGARVLGLDRATPPHTDGSSHGESRIIREAYFEGEHYVPLVRRAGELWEALERESGRSLLRRAGALMLGPPGGELIAGSRLSAARHGIPVEELTPQEVARRFAWMKVAPGTAALLEPGAGVLDPEGCIRAHLELASAGGAELRTGRAAVSWREGGGGVEVRMDDGSVAGGDVLVLCAGPWMPELLRATALRVERQVMLWFKPLAGEAARHPADGPAFLWETSRGELFYGMPGAGGTLKAARHHGGAVGALSGLSEQVSPADEQLVRSFLEKHIPGAAGALDRAVVCRYTNTPTGRFLIDSLPGEPRVHVVSACSGHGFKFASAIGEAVARRVLGEGDALDLSSFRSAAALG